METIELYATITTAIAARMRIKFHYTSCLYVYGNTINVFHLIALTTQLEDRFVGQVVFSVDN